MHIAILYALLTVMARRLVCPLTILYTLQTPPSPPPLLLLYALRTQHHYSHLSALSLMTVMVQVSHSVGGGKRRSSRR